MNIQYSLNYVTNRYVNIYFNQHIKFYHTAIVIIKNVHTKLEHADT